METISIADFERLVSERLSNPKAYTNRTLLLWDGRYTRDSIEYEVMEQCCLDYNGIHPDNQIWFRYSDFCFQDEDYSKGRAFCEYEEMYGYKPCRILFNTGCFMTNKTDDWIKFVNSHTNNKGQLPDDCVLIACVQANSSCNFREEQFSDNCDIVCLKPSLEEWRQWMSSRCNPTVLAQVLSFIKTNEIELDYFYLGRIISALEYTMESRKLQSIEQLSYEDFKLAVCGIAPGFSTDNFWKFIQTQNNNNHE